MTHDWPEPAVLEANRRRLLAETRQELAAYEQRYGIASADVHAAIDDGRIEETADVCSWLIAWDFYDSLLGPADG